MTCRHRRASVVTHGPYVDALWCQGCGGLRLRRDGKWQQWLRPILTHIAAERRGEDRVLRWMDRVRASAWIDGAHRPVVSEYRKARRARVGRGR